MSGKMICPTCKGNGFVWVDPNNKKERWAVDCKKCNNQGEIEITEESINILLDQVQSARMQ